MPLQVGGHAQDELVVDLSSAAHARGRAWLLCREAQQSGPAADPPRPPRPGPPGSLALGRELHHEKKEADFLKVPGDWKPKNKNRICKGVLPPSLTPKQKQKNIHWDRRFTAGCCSQKLRSWVRRKRNWTLGLCGHAASTGMGLRAPPQQPHRTLAQPGAAPPHRRLGQATDTVHI